MFPSLIVTFFLEVTISKWQMSNFYICSTSKSFTRQTRLVTPSHTQKSSRRLFQPYRGEKLINPQIKYGILQYISMLFQDTEEVTYLEASTLW